MNVPKKISPHFYYHEFFSEGIWRSSSETFLMKLIDPRIVQILEKLRVEMNAPIYVNNWYWGGNSMYRGFRPQSTSVGAKYSQHKMGRAVDFHVGRHTITEVHEYILSREPEFLDLGLTRLEDVRDAPTWVHLDLGWTGLDGIYVFRA